MRKMNCQNQTVFFHNCLLFFRTPNIFAIDILTDTFKFPIRYPFSILNIYEIADITLGKYPLTA
jgi:hypothetical protein